MRHFAALPRLQLALGDSPGCAHGSGQCLVQRLINDEFVYIIYIYTYVYAHICMYIPLYI